jgi:CDP-diacylglycerol--glycerol-3-phosphate 3-phosphatidyltransferase
MSDATVGTTVISSVQSSSRSWVKKVPNCLSFGRIVGVVPTTVLIMLLLEYRTVPLYYITLILVSVIAISDWIDGLWAREFNCGSTWGKFLDEYADKMTMLLFLPFCSVGMIPLQAVIIVLFRDMFVTFLRHIVSKETNGAETIKVGWFGKLRTIIHLVFLPVLTASINPPHTIISPLFSHPHGLYYWTGWFLIVPSVWSGYIYYKMFKQKGFSLPL